jgi:hypothetical protein
MGILENANAIPTAAAADFYTYQIENSCRLNEPDDAGFNFTMGTPTNTKKWAMGMWLKRSIIAESAEPTLFQTVISGGGSGQAIFTSGDKLKINRSVDDEIERETSALFRDTGAWMQIVIIIDTTESGDDKLKIYQNGTQITSFGTSNEPTSDGAVTYNTSGNALYIGRNYWADSLGGYVAQVFGVDGQDVSITDFGTSKNGVWIPDDLSGLTFGNNGFLLDFASSGDMGNDVSGNGNDFTVSDVAASDQMLDSPTFDGTSQGGNFPTIGGLEKNTGGFTFSEGNLKYAVSTNQRGFIFSQGVPESGKYYWEVRATQYGGSEDQLNIGVCQPDKMRDNLTGSRGGSQVSGAGGYTFDQYNGAGWLDGSKQSDDSIGYKRAAPQTFGFAIDRDNDTFKWTYDGSTYSSTYTIPSSGVLAPYIGSGGGTSTASGVFNFGADSTFAGLVTAGGNADENGYGNFSLAVPSGYLAMCAANLPTPAADPASEEGPNKYFVPKLYTGDGASTLAITGLEFQPDWTWIKNRDQTDSHCLFDSSRGVTKLISSDDSAVESTDADTLKSFTSDGFTVGADVKVNTSSEKYVSWNWKVNGGTTASNTTGDKTSTVQVDTDRGISIVQYTGNETAETIGHSLGAKPELIIVKCRSFDRSWAVQWVDVNNTTSYILNTTGSDASHGYWNNTSPTSTVFTVGVGTETNKDTKTFVAYCFVSKEGFSKVGTYEGNGNADGTFVYTGFRPAFIMTRSVDSTSDWQIFDDQREGYNVDNDELVANSTAVETTTDYIDILSNGFKLRTTSDPNVAETYGYIAFAKNPFKYSLAR